MKRELKIKRDTVFMKYSVLFFFILIVLFVNNLSAQEDSPPVQNLKELYKTDKVFQTTIKAMFENLQDLPDGTRNPWRNKNINDLYSFLNEWFYFLPNTHNGLDRIVNFTMLYYQNPAGMKFILEEPGLSWANYFVEERGKFMDSQASAHIISEWLDDPSLNNDDFVMPLDGFKSFNEFFIRDLKPGA